MLLRSTGLRLLARLTATGVVVAVGGLVPAVAAHGAASWRDVAYGAERFVVPADWPIDHLGADPSLCVRFDRHAVYEGAGPATSSCPPQLAGVTEAMQLEPLDAAGRAQAGPDLRAATVGGQPALVNTDRSVTQRLIVEFPTAGVVVTISYGKDPALARRILASFHATSGPSAAATTTLPPAAPATGSTSRAPSRSTKAPRSLPTATTSPDSVGPVSVGPVVWRGDAFDACSAPSSSAMAAWRADSPYRAVGVYIGGVNRACGDGNLSSTWVDSEVAAGWDLIPIYVGLQASCADQTALAPIVAALAPSEGRQAADDAVVQARYFGIGVGSPIFLDMEAWDTTDTSCSAGVVAFVKAWDHELVHDRFIPGVYGSADSGIAQYLAPLSAKTGLPRLVDIADWDGLANTTSPYVASAYWPDHQRLKQFEGDVSEAYGGFALQIDKDYVDSTIVGNEQPDVTALTPASGAVGTTITVTGRGFVSGHTTVDFGGVRSVAVDVTSSRRLTARVPARSILAVDVTVISAGGTSGTDLADRFTYVPIVGVADRATGGYWLTTSRGNVYQFHAPWSGSSATMTLPAPVVGVAEDARTGGYWLVTAAGGVYNFDAPWYGSMAGKTLPAPVVGMAADPGTGGYWLVTSAGNVYNFHAPAYGGAPSGKTSVTSIAADAASGGYWLVTSSGNVYNEHAPWYGSESGRGGSPSVTGVAADAATGGYWLVTSEGGVYNFHAPWYGSRAGRALAAPVSSISAAGHGYLLVTAAGNVYNFAARFYGSPAG